MKAVFRKKIITVLVTLLLIFLAGCFNSSVGEQEKIIAFRNVTVIDAVEGLRENQTVIVSGNKITSAGPAAKIKIPSGAEVISCRGKYLIPGLWDAHMHLTNSSVIAPAMYPLLIANGITYIRDTAAELGLIMPLLREAARAADSAGMAPAVYFTGPHLDGKQLSWSSSVSAVSPARARKIIDSLIDAGVDQVKVYDLLPREVFLEVLSYAKSKGLKVSAHVPFDIDVVEASEAGLASMEHMFNLEMSLSSDWDSLLQARRKMIAKGSKMKGGELREAVYHAQRLHSFRTQDEERRAFVLRTLAKNETWQVPTLVILAAEEHRLYAREDFQRTFRYLPEPARSEWIKEANRQASNKPSEEELQHAYWAYDLIPRLIESGDGIMAGTDMPLAHLTPGFSLHEELALLVKCGMSPMQALESATLKPAEFFGKQNEQGSIATGMSADLVLLDANPLDDIKSTQRINSVMRNGFLHTRKELDAILSKLESSGKDIQH
jgi:imidazolonepropionase-like amidohydrolase